MANMVKVEAMMNDAKVLESLAKCSTKEEMLAVVNAQGAEMNEAELKDMLKALKASVKKDEAMDMDDMEAVAGGGIFSACFRFATNIVSIPWNIFESVGMQIVDKAVDLYDEIFD